MPYDRDSFLAGLAVGRTLWRPHRDVSGDIRYHIHWTVSGYENQSLPVVQGEMSKENLMQNGLHTFTVRLGSANPSAYYFGSTDNRNILIAITPLQWSYFTILLSTEDFLVYRISNDDPRAPLPITPIASTTIDDVPYYYWIEIMTGSTTWTYPAINVPELAYVGESELDIVTNAVANTTLG